MSDTSEKTKWTPGPWKYSRTHGLSSDTWYVITNAEGYGPIMEAGGKDRNGQIAEAKYLITDPARIEANAALIAAAPEMYAALSALVAEAKRCVADDEEVIVIKQAQAALRSARGDK